MHASTTRPHLRALAGGLTFRPAQTPLPQGGTLTSTAGQTLVQKSPYCLPPPFLSTSQSSLCLWPHPPLLYPPNFQEFFPNVNRSLAGPGRPCGDPTAPPRAEHGPRTDGASWPRVLPLDSAQGSLSQEGFGDPSLTITRVSIPPSPPDNSPPRAAV